MTQSKSTPKERNERQRKARTLRRALADITPANSHHQQQSPLFSYLPRELRFLIFEIVLSQKQDQSRRIDVHSISPLYRPGHSYHTTSSLSLLRTCRLIFYEAHAIPLRSATHHFRYLGSTSWLYRGDLWLHHIPKQCGAELYHLHDNVIALNAENFTKFFLPHLKWRRVTWTVCTYLCPSLLAVHNQIDRLAETLGQIVLPESCQEVTLELETREDLPHRWTVLREQAIACRKANLRKSDGSELAFDDERATQYTWVGSGQARWGTSETSREKERMEYRTLRLCWRAKVARREYTSYDQVDCLRLEGCADVKNISPFIDEYMREDTKN